MRPRPGTTIVALLAAVALLVLPGAASAANLASGFDSSDEGWRIRDNHVNYNITQAPDWVPEGGNPGGFIRVTDTQEPVIWQALAPAAWLGDKTANYGGSIALDVRHTAPQLGPGISIESQGSGFLTYTFNAKPSGWRTYSAPLTETDQCWTYYPPTGTFQPSLPTKAQFSAVLSDIDRLSVSGELGPENGDIGEIDNIRLSESPSGSSLGCAPPPDSDGDGIPDESDACPAQPGIPPFGGCNPPFASGPPPVAPGCQEAAAKLAKARDKLEDAEGRKAKAKAREKVKKAKRRMKDACG